MGNSPSVNQVPDTDEIDLSLEAVPKYLDIAQDEAKSDDEKSEAIGYLEMIRSTEPEGAVEVLMPFVINLASKLSTIEHEGYYTAALQLICGMCATNDATLLALKPHFDTLLGFLSGAKANEIVRNSVYAMVEELLEKDPSYETLILERLSSMVNAQTDDKSTRDLVNGLYLCACWGRTHCTTVQLKANFFDLAQKGLGSDNKELYQQSQGVLGYYLTDNDFQAQVFEITGQEASAMRKWIVEAFVDLMSRPESAWADPCVEKLTQLEEEEDKALVRDVAGNKWWTVLVSRLQFKDPDVVGAPEEWALVKQTEEDPAVVIQAFKEWFEGNSDVQVKLTMADSLRGTFESLRNAAFSGGWAPFVLGCVKSGDVKVSVKALNILIECAASSQRVGSILLDTDGACDDIIAMVGSPSAEIRRAALKTLASICDGYSEDGQSLRNTARDRFSTPKHLPTLLAALADDDKATGGAAANLLMEMMLSESGTEDWNYDNERGDPLPPTPLKDTLLTSSDFVEMVMGLLKHDDSKKEALALLAQCVFGHDNGQKVIREGFKARLGEDEFFWAALAHPNVRAAALSTLAYEAGAYPRTIELLQSAIGKPTRNRVAIVDGLCLMIASDDADQELVKQEGKLKNVLRELLCDAEAESLASACWVMRLLKEQDGWSDELGGDDVVKALVKLLERGVDDVGAKPYEDALSVAAYRKACREYKEKKEDANTRHVKILNNVVRAVKHLLPFMGVRASAFVKLFLKRLDDSSDVLEAIQEIALVDGFDQNVLVDAMNDIIEGMESRELCVAREWAAAGGEIAPAIPKTRVIDRLVKESPSDSAAIVTLAEIIKAVVPDDANVIRKTFFETVDAEKVVEGEEDDEVIGALFGLAEGYPAGLARLGTPAILQGALERFVDADRSDAESLAGVVMYGCGQDEAYAKKVVTMVRGWVDALAVKRKKGKTPKMPFHDAWRRFRALSEGGDGRKVLVEGGVFREIKRVLEKREDDNDRAMAARLLKALTVEHPEEDRADGDDAKALLGIIGNMDL